MNMSTKYLVVWIITGLILASTTNTTEQSQNHGSPRIYVPAGRPVKEREFPYLVMLRTSFGNVTLTFTGTIPSRSTVLSNTVYIMGNITAYAGLVSYNVTEMDTTQKPVEQSPPELRNDQLQVRSVTSVAVQEKFYVVVRLVICYVDKPWVWTGYVESVSLHLTKTSLDESGMSFQVMGFGWTGKERISGVAHVMNQQIGNYSMCKEFPQIMIILLIMPDAKEFVLCSIDVKDKTLCPGDHGAPAMYNNMQWAVAYFSLSIDCEFPVDYNAYIDIAYFRDWILKNIEDLPSAGSVRRCSVKFSIYGVLVCEPLWLFLLTAVEVLYLH